MGKTIRDNLQDGREQMQQIRKMAERVVKANDSGDTKYNGIFLEVEVGAVLVWLKELPIDFDDLNCGKTREEFAKIGRSHFLARWDRYLRSLENQDAAQLEKQQ